jgi:hypothetical protein
MSDDLTDEERDLLAAHREKNRKPRRVRIFGEHDGSKYEFEVEGEEADRVIARHKALFADEPAPEDGKDKAPGRPHLIPRSVKGA